MVTGSSTSFHWSFDSNPLLFAFSRRLRETDLSPQRTTQLKEDFVNKTYDTQQVDFSQELVLPSPELLELHPPPSPRECFTIIPSRRETVKRKCLLCDIVAEKSHLTSAGHKANLLKYCAFLKEMGCENSEAAFGAYLGSTARIRKKYSKGNDKARLLAIVTPPMRSAPKFQAIPIENIPKRVVKLRICLNAYKNWKILMSHIIELHTLRAQVEAFLEASVVPHRCVVSKITVLIVSLVFLSL